MRREIAFRLTCLSIILVLLNHLNQSCNNVLSCINSCTILPCGAHICVIINKNRVLNLCNAVLRRAILDNVNLSECVTKPLVKPFNLCTLDRTGVLYRPTHSAPTDNADSVPISLKLVKYLAELVRVNKRGTVRIGKRAAVVQMVEPIVIAEEVSNGSIHVKVDCPHVISFLLDGSILDYWVWIVNNLHRISTIWAGALELNYLTNKVNPQSDEENKQTPTNIDRRHPIVAIIKPCKNRNPKSDETEPTKSNKKSCEKSDHYSSFLFSYLDYIIT